MRTTKQIDTIIAQLDPSAFSGYAKETTPSGTTVRKLTTADPSIWHRI